MPPRSTSSNPNLAGSRKASNPSLNGAASSSTESLPSSTHIAVPVKVSVMQRTRDLEQKAVIGYQSNTSPRMSPHSTSRFKTGMIGPFSIPQSSGRRPSAPTSSGSAPNTPSGEGRRNSPRFQNTPAPILEDLAKITKARSSEVVRKDTPPSTDPSEDSGEEDQDETPRQSTNFTATPAKISRQDSSRQANYSLKPLIYSPTLPRTDKRSETAPAPQLPKLYFEGSPAQNLATDSPSTKSARSPYTSPNTELSRAGWTGEKGTGGDKLGAPEIKHDGQIVQSPPSTDEIDASNHSFLWHSPHDSTDETDDEHDSEENPGGFPAMPKRSQSTLTSATALGFGGPSDWEHFYGGDYSTTDLIDDTDMYLRKDQEQDDITPAIRSLRDTVDMQDMPIDAQGTDDQQTLTEMQLREPHQLPTIQEHGEGASTDIVTQHVDYESNLDDFARSPPPVTPAVFTAPAPLPESVISNNSASSSTDALTPQGSIISQKPSKETIVHTPTEESEREETETAPKVGEHMNAKEPTIKGIEVDKSTPTPRTPPPSEIKMPSNDFTSVASLASGPSSPPADDPNASEITISMVVTPDFDPLSQSSKGQSQVGDPASSPRKSVFPQADELPNPYFGLAPIAKASLNRFIRMLREEEKTDGDHDKYFIFVEFMRHELKLRATLYDMDDESEISVPASARQSLMSSIASGRGKRQSARQKPLPIPPDGRSTLDPTIGRAQSILASSAGQVPREETHFENNSGTQSHVGKSFPDNEAALSSTGAIEAREPVGDKSLEPQTSLEKLNRSIDLVAPRSSIMSISSLSRSTPQLSADAKEQQVAAASPLPGSKILEHSLSVHSNESRPYDGDKATNRQSIYRPFSGMLRSSSSHRRASTESIATVKSAERAPERKATDPGSLKTIVDKNKSSPSDEAVRAASADPLLAVIPQNNILREEHRQLAGLRFDMDNVIDDFSFIHKTVLAWDSGAKVRRERYEHERQQRTSDNERRVDELFDGNEIGYSDIGHLEDEFKRSESTKKAQEEREEVESFVSSVFDVVWARINYEMDQLTPLYQDATRLVADASAGKHMFEDMDDRVPIALIMEILLILYQKLMIRHQKAFEAVLERDRRLKKTEVSPWLSVGQFDKVKRIEKRFEDAEKKAILEFCRQRDERANQLMDVLDQHTLRGVGANQDYMESVMQAVRKVSVRMATKSDSSKVDSPRPSHDDVIKAKLVTGALARSSEEIVRTFHVADMLLNAADYEVSVANAKLSNADAAAFKRLRDAKATEDAKLAADLEHRLGLIRSDTSRTNEEIAKLMLLNGQHDPELRFDIGKERDKRMVAALNAAESNEDSKPPPLPK